MRLIEKIFIIPGRIREAIKETYIEIRKDIVMKGLDTGTLSPHRAALIYTLKIHYDSSLHRKRKITTLELFSELVPFFLLGETESVYGLAEYILFKGKRQRGSKDFLRRIINNAFRENKCWWRDYGALSGWAVVNAMQWTSLLEEDIVNLIMEKTVYLSESQDC